MELIIAIIGFLMSIVPLIVLPLKIRAGKIHYFLLYIFLVLFYLSYIGYSIWHYDIFIMLIYIFEMLFFLNMYRAYLKKEFFFVAPFIAYSSDLAIIFSFYFITFNLVEIGKNVLAKKGTSPIVLYSLISFELAVIAQLLTIISQHQYLNIIITSLFLAGTALFIIPGLRVAYEKEKI
ncbi:hypothetical protein [Candidatus Aciduliprofundum boonei]|uniref:Uncharacterized protein n=1 Tax=Aciduliprofundum boonei (strain DSM 19572 / T469) TaxID=439481 RepID=B5IEG1_ACIB4|nr:hypothetical protein [Candidatus Aciduliprofundum boonei]ADD07953.1 hypothetical protein Aboo_0141 [Aciduliprofundum boonei T469]EDY35225.1 hypothetical protein ABOONEI_296 [Aciduliprofundum boonei T469]EDY35353.1 hypothetical protein ABOONEI_2801 [Aciduliprofundum boonei T469]HII55178.1 hypothetical protein [Candidatus Aciduliprofundum boonei]